MVIVQGDSETDNYTYLMFYVFGNIGRVFLLSEISAPFNCNSLIFQCMFNILCFSNISECL